MRQFDTTVGSRGGRVGSERRAKQPYMNPKKILIVDDDSVIRKAFASKLTGIGYEVILAADPSAALGAVREKKPDLIVLDITFPPDISHGGIGVSDGFLTMDWLKRMETDRRTPVIIISVGDAAKYKQKALAAGALAYFQKPVQSDELLAAIQQALGEGPSAPPTPSVEPNRPAL